MIILPLPADELPPGRLRYRADGQFRLRQVAELLPPNREPSVRLRFLFLAIVVALAAGLASCDEAQRARNQAERYCADHTCDDPLRVCLTW